MNKVVDELWQIAYKSFNRPNEVFEMPAITGGTGASKQVGHRLLNTIAELKEGTPLTSEVLGLIRADVLLSEASGWVSPDSAQKMHQLLDVLAQEIDASI